jgi:ubiquitin-conjugating enzyme E2 Q
MSFKKFKSDVATAAQKVITGSISGVLSVAAGDSDGEVVVKYRHDSLSANVRIQALAQNVSEYPDGNMFMLWTDDADPPPPVEAAIKAAQDFLLGMSVYEMVTELARRLENEFSGTVDSDDESLAKADDDEDEDDYDAAYDADYPSDGDEFGLPSSTARYSHPISKLKPDQKPVLQRIRRDLRQVNQAGYKVGFLDPFGQTSTSGVVSISIRVNKLALSDEAMEAWDVQPSEYVVLLLRFQKSYDTLERIIEQHVNHTDVQFRIGKCNRFKPSLKQVLGAFSESNRNLATDPDTPVDDLEHSDVNFEKLFISNSLDQFLEESFVSLLKLRETRGIDWDEANDLFRTRIGLFTEDQRLPVVPEGVSSDGSSLDPKLTPERHHILFPDHLLENGPANERSLPLLAMQFAMRYFVRCTEYCLRCHRRLEKGFEALRPYVCSDPLCLFQYMAMGFGPSIEHEILTEPYVVDLLVSFCYAAIQPCSSPTNWSSPRPTPTQSKLPIRSLPVGLRLRVPDMTNTTGDCLRARVQLNDTRLVFEDNGAKSFGERLAPTKWVAFRKPGQSLTYHARIVETNDASKSATIEVMGQSSACWGVGQHAYGPGHLEQAPRFGPGTPAEDALADVFPYVADFDSLDDVSKGDAMRHILDSLPPILDIEEWLNRHPQSSLRNMDRISPAAASLLQWIVSSNRSCIFQVDRSRAVARRRKGWFGAQAPGIIDSASESKVVTREAGRGRNREHERIPGMDGWVQFRFAQGSPDKELRFNRALQEVAARKHMQSDPTIFAWHGSSLANWHSIVRTGLDFTEMRTGRAFGHGVYFSPQCGTSLTYAVGGGAWPNSDLMVSTCLSLNEIINAPEEFVSRSPHYVVSQPDWHQCRYLFVRTPGLTDPGNPNPQAGGALITQSSEVEDGQAFYPQVKGFEVYGQGQALLQIPLSAVPLRTIGASAVLPPAPSKRTVHLLEDSDNDDAGDVSILFTDDEFIVVCGPPSKKSTSRASSVDLGTALERYVNPSLRAPAASETNRHPPTLRNATAPPTPASIGRSLTDFEPGALDLSSLPRLEPPSFATDAATKALSRELSKLQNIQAKTPLHELGWYMDCDQVTNLFQWIVELHSFDPSLLLAQDMKRAGVASVVLELRFGGDYPFSPPFVRVVRPRFLPFLEGGGGHVTAGGAMCMELLTSSGWSPANSMESIFLQVRMAICSLEPKAARLDMRRMGMGMGMGSGSGRAGPQNDYGVGEAVDAFMRAARTHGWAVPEGLHATAFGV